MHILRFISVALCVACASVAHAEPLLHNPVAPQGVEHKHDYSTVDISTLNGWEKTFVPEARKEPILRELLSDGDWIPSEIGPGYSPPPYCRSVLEKVLAWDGVTIVEPVIRTNSFGHPKFNEWHKKCPGFIPHETHFVTGPDISPRYATHHFKVFEMPSGVLKQGEALFYAEGLLADTYIDGYGNLGLEISNAADFGRPDGSGSYRIVNLSACERGYFFNAIPGEGFSYFSDPQYSVLESVVISLDGEHYVLSISNYGESGKLRIRQVNAVSVLKQVENCHFDN